MLKDSNTELEFSQAKGNWSENRRNKQRGREKFWRTDLLNKQQMWLTIAASWYSQSSNQSWVQSWQWCRRNFNFHKLTVILESWIPGISSGNTEKRWLIVLGEERDHVRRILKDEQDFVIWRRNKLRSKFNLHKEVRKESELREGSLNDENLRK